MSRFIQTAALVVGGIALVATGAGALAGAGLLGTAASAAAAAGTGLLGTLATVATFAQVATVGLGIAGALTAAKASSGGSPDQWKANPEAGMDIVFGEAMPGVVIYRGCPP
ncbi:hypothetical protein ASG20_14210 [Sphingomonas sp. Leaf198]|nr:hypothetical protein ASG20_14210 [Sphingomonas sp. Leaf198]